MYASVIGITIRMKSTEVLTLSVLILTLNAVHFVLASYRLNNSLKKHKMSKSIKAFKR